MNDTTGLLGNMRDVGLQMGCCSNVYMPSRPLEEIEADLKAVEGEILDLLKQVTEE